MKDADQDLRDTLMDTAAEIVGVLLDKRADYGTKNIAMTGRAGLAVRLLDKAARLWNLAFQEERVKSETVQDTYRDIIGYALIGLHPEWWSLEEE